MYKRLSGIVLLLILLVSLACAGGRDAASGATPAPAPTAAPRPAAIAPAKGWADTSIAFSVYSSQIPQRMVVRTINMAMQVKDIPQILNSIASLAEGMGGFVVSSNLAGEEENINGYITIRVPSEKTDETLTQIRSLSLRVTNEQTNAQDVTEEYVDIQSRLKTLEATEAQLLTLLNRADKVEDILAVYRELTNIRSQIEQMKGRIQYLERTSSTSLISVSLSLSVSKKPLAPRGWNALETVKNAFRSLSFAGQGLANSLIWVGIFSPIWLPILVVLLVIIYRKARLSRK
ncbi:MAG: DUF4349 domain-containing protein [Chloroflexi bacterium]|nr:DUF4349 domain-containing protein [Chloroflexota bacterium]